MQRSTVLSLAFFACTAWAQDASQPRFTARELFYAASDPAPAAKPAPPATPPAPKNNVAAAKKPVVAPPVQTAAATPVPTAPSQPAPASVAPAPSGSVDSSMVVKAALVTAPKPANGTPLGLKYTILKRVGDNMVEVPPDTIFHAKDAIQLSVQTNGPGYLYIVLRGSSGTWRAMFPSPEVADGNNHVDGWSPRAVPPGSRMAFDDLTGTEELFVVFSRTPEEGLENMIYSLQGGAAKPAAQPEKAMDKPAKKFLVTASVQIPDAAVGILRNTYTRDLIIEKVDDKTPADKSAAEKQENAVYVVNPSGSADSRVVADIKLVHR